MKNKRICKTLSALCLTMVVAFGFTIPAFAQGSEQAPAAPAEDSTNDSNVIVEETEPAAHYHYHQGGQLFLHFDRQG